MSARDILGSGGANEGPVYVDDVFSTYVYKGNSGPQAAGQDIVNNIQLGTGFTTVASLGGPSWSGDVPHFGRFSAIDYAKSGAYLFAFGNSAYDGLALLYYSNNSGATWAQAPAVSGLGVSLKGCAFFGGKIFVASNGGIFSAPIGTGTFSLANYTTTQGRGIKLANGKLFALGTNNNTDSLGYSDDGVTFQQARGYDITYPMLDIAYGDGYYYLLGVNVNTGTSCTIFRSSDLSTWTTLGNVVGDYYSRIAYGNNILVVSGGSQGGNGKVYYSSNYGGSFTTVSTVPSVAWDIDFDGDKFYLGSYGYSYSHNAVNWTKIGVPNQGSGFVRYTDGSYIISYPENYPVGCKPKIATKSISLGKGGLVWTKARYSNNPIASQTTHVLVDTVRGPSISLSTSNTLPAIDRGAQGLHTFYAQGYSFGTAPDWALVDQSFVSWTFRKAPKFFDIVTYTGNGVNGRIINHSLDMIPGMIIIKRTDSSSTTGDWMVWHRQDGLAHFNLVLNSTNGQGDGTQQMNGFIGNSAASMMTSNSFTVYGGGVSDSNVNASGATYVAYIYAHDTSPTGLIKCGTFNPSASATVDLGWEPQFLLFKAADYAGSWYMMDSQRHWPALGSVQPGVGEAGGAQYLLADRYGDGTGGAGDFRVDSGYEVAPTSSGFKTTGPFVGGQSVIYMAIRGPNKPPTVGTQVYKSIARTGTGVAATINGVGFAPDLVLMRGRNHPSYQTNAVHDRLRGAKKFIQTNTQGPYEATAGESSGVTSGAGLTSLTAFDNMDGLNIGADGIGFCNIDTIFYINHFFKRAPGFFDIVCWTGDGTTTRSISHNLAVVPTLIITKKRTGVGDWYTGCDFTSTTYKYLHLNESVAATTYTYANSPVYGGNPTASVFTVGATAPNAVGLTQVSYLFASCPGVSKVGSYTGNGSSQNIACGFAAGARFILIKRTDSSGDWFIWDTARGIISANDPHLSLNTTATEVSADDSVDPDNSGFIVNQVSATNINVTSATYIFLAIA